MLNLIVALLLLTYGLSFYALRELGPMILLSLSLFCSIPFLKHRPHNIFKNYHWFLIYALFILILSLQKLIPTSWTIYYRQDVIPRQFSWVILLPVFTYSLMFGWSYVRTVTTAQLIVFFLVACFISRASRVFANQDLEYLFNFHTLTNDNMILTILFCLLIFRTNYKTVSACASLFLFGISTSFQSTIFAVCVLAISCSDRPAKILYSLTAALIMVSAVSPFYSFLIHDFDANSGIRARMWYDTLLLLRDTYGLGVGFGTEYINPEFSDLKGYHWQMVSQYDPNLLFVGTHNAGYDILSRLGVIGILLFAFWFSPFLILRSHWDNKDQRTYASVFSAVIISAFANPALVTINFLIGTSACIALCLTYKVQPQKL